MGKAVNFEHDEEVTSPFSRAVAYASSLKRHRAEEDPAAFPSKRLQKGINAGATLTVDRFLYYEKGRWVEFPANLTQGLSANLKAGKTAVELLVQSCVYLVNFVQMVLVNSRSGYGRSIGWIDKAGKRYASSCPFEGPFLGLVLNRQNNNALGAVKSLVAEYRPKQDMEGNFSERMACQSEIRSQQEQQSLVEHDTDPETSCTGENDVECRLAKETIAYEMHGCSGSTDSCSEAASGIYLEPGSKVLCENECDGFAAVNHKIHKMNKDDVPYQALEKKFLAGIGVPATKLTVQAVYRTVNSGKCEELRRQAFEMQKEITCSARGNANVRYVWFGASKTVLQNIILHGFGQPTLMKRSSPGGVGVHFTGDHYPSLSVTYSEADEMGLQHMLLCQVILGNMERVQSGSDQFQPSSEDFDSGVDDLENPKRFCVWSTHMNTHIFPRYLISFKVSDQLQAFSSSDFKFRVASQKTIPRCNQDVMEPSTVLRGCNSPHSHLARQQEISNEKKELRPGSPCSPLKDSTPSNITNSYPAMMSFPVLFSILKKHVPAETVAAVKKLLIEFKSRRVSREQFMQDIKCIVGKELLLSSIEEMKSHVRPNIAIFCSVLSKCDNRNQANSQKAPAAGGDVPAGH